MLVLFLSTSLLYAEDGGATSQPPSAGTPEPAASPSTPPPSTDPATPAPAPDAAPAEPAPAAAAAGATPSGTAPAPVIDLSKAEEAPGLNREDYEGLKPDRDQLPINPYAQVDYSAYTLEWGEFSAGVPTLAAGVLPRTQLSTNWVLYPLCAMPDTAYGVCVPNIDLKVNALRAGPVDVGLQWTWSDGTIRYSIEGVQAPPVNVATIGVGGALSLLVKPNWGIHASGLWRRAAVNGSVPTNMLVGALSGSLGVPDGLPLEQVLGGDTTLEVWHQDALVRLATDVHFSRKRVFIIKAQALVWSSTPYTIKSGDAEERDELEAETSVGSLIGQSFVGGFDYQIAYRAADFWVGLRVRPGAIALLGLGVPALPVYPTVGMNFRFGGETRAGERRMLRSWRQNDEDVP